MTLLGLIIAIVVVGVLLWLINTYLPMDATVKKILNVVVIAVLCFWLLSMFIGGGSILNAHVGR